MDRPTSIAARTHDEITGRPMLPKERLVHGAYYVGRCGNATIARWNAEENCFFHWREKFDNVFVERIKYPTDESETWWDVFFAVRDLVNPKFEIPFDGRAEFVGNPADLTEYDVEMWRKIQK